MFKNYLLIAWRNFRRHKTFSLINIAGLAVGMACFVLIMLYVQYELSFDRIHEKADRIYRVVVQQPQNIYLGSDHFAVTQAILAPTLKAEFPDVLESVTIDKDDNVLISVGGQSFYENNLVWADSPIFEIFTFPLLHGDPKARWPFAVVLSETLARKYFGEENPLGKVIRYQDQNDFKVTGECGTRRKFSFPGRYARLFSNAHRHERLQGPVYPMGQQLVPDLCFSPARFRPQGFRGEAARHCQEISHRSMARRATAASLLFAATDGHSSLFAPQFRYWQEQRYSLHLSALRTGRHHHVDGVHQLHEPDDRPLIVARQRVGMRKVVGANRLQLLKQFIGESMLLAATAALIALLIVELFRRSFQNWSNANWLSRCSCREKFSSACWRRFF
jgi:putative ABC transport system permease protein